MSTLDDATLSKNARKRIARAAHREKRRAERKESERAAKRALAEKIKTEFHEKVNAMTPEEREAFFAERAANLLAKRERDVAKKEAKARQLSSTHEILIDCEFGDLMSKPKEWSSFSKQLRFVYERNSKTTAPFKLTFTGLDGEFGDFIRRTNGGSENWHVVRETRTIREMIEADAEKKKRFVYLTGDSENELSALEDGTVYVIGGFIDRNRHKGLTLNKARELGVAHARLPISEHLKLRGSYVLTVNQTTNVLTSYRELEDWGKAMESVVPLRKVRKDEGENAAEEETEDRGGANAFVED